MVEIWRKNETLNYPFLYFLLALLKVCKAPMKNFIKNLNSQILAIDEARVNPWSTFPLYKHNNKSIEYRHEGVRKRRILTNLLTNISFKKLTN